MTASVPSSLCSRMLIGVGVLLIGAAVALRAQTLDPAFAGNYALVDLGTATNVTTPYGGLTFLAGNPNTILLGGSANNTGGKIFAIPVRRDASNHIIGFSGPATWLADARGIFGGIDGGLDYGPNNVLFYTSYPDNVIGQIRPGSTNYDKLIDMTAAGVASSVGSLLFVPPGFGGAGRLKIASYNAHKFYDAVVNPDGAGTFNITVLHTNDNFVGGPEGFIYVSGRNPGFTNDSLLVSEYQSGAIATYVVNAIGDPITTTRRLFVTGLSGAEGAAVDPLTGDFLFSTFSGGNHVVAIRGFAAPPQRIPLGIQRLPNEVQVSWGATPTNWVLEFTADIVGPWANDATVRTVQNGTNSILKPVNGVPRFWRLRYQP